MCSDRRGFVWLLACLIAGMGCTEEIPIEPISTSADDWTPTFTVESYGYQKVAIRIDGPPRKELVPNIARYVFSVREFSSTIDIPIDTFFAVSPSYVDVRGRLARLLWTDARVPVGKDYWPKLSVEYRNGVVRSWEGTSLPRDPSRGTILRRFDISTLTKGDQWWLDSKLALWRSRPLFNHGDRLYVLDTLAGIPQYVGDLSIAGSAPGAPGLLFMGVDGDTVITALSPWSGSSLRLTKMNLNTFSVDTSVVIGWAIDEYLMAASAINGKLALLMSIDDGRYRFRVFDTRTGALVQTYPPGLPSESIVGGVSFDGTNFWVSQHAYPFTYPNLHFHPIVQIDPNTMAFTQVHRNPVDYFNISLVEPTTAWIVDENWPRSIIEARLEGF